MSDSNQWCMTTWFWSFIDPLSLFDHCFYYSEKFKNLVVEELHPSAKAADVELKCLCDVCETADAIRYCVEDQQKLCDEHLKVCMLDVSE